MLKNDLTTLPYHKRASLFNVLGFFSTKCRDFLSLAVVVLQQLLLFSAGIQQQEVRTVNLIVYVGKVCQHSQKPKTIWNFKYKKTTYVLLSIMIWVKHTHTYYIHIIKSIYITQFPLFFLIDLEQSFEEVKISFFCCSLHELQTRLQSSDHPLPSFSLQNKKPQIRLPFHRMLPYYMHFAALEDQAEKSPFGC